VNAVLERGIGTCQAQILAHRSVSALKDQPNDEETQVPFKRTALDAPLALPTSKMQDSHFRSPDLPDSLSSHDDDVSAYRLQVLGPQRCEILSRAAPNFVCQKGTSESILKAEQKQTNTGSADSDAARFMTTILNGLDDLISVYCSCGEEWRMRNYEIARVYMSATFESLLLRNETFRTCDELQFQIKRHKLERATSLGEKTWRKLRDIEEWGSCSKADALMNERDAVLKRQMGAMWGIGPVLLNKFWSRGCRSRKDVLDQVDCPSRCKVADQHYDSMQLRMPRCEVDVISKLIFQQILRRYKGGEFKFEVVGSYRRGRYDSGDIDCLLSPHDHKMNSNMLPDIVDLLEAQGLAFDHLQLPNRNREFIGKNTYMGFSRLPDSATVIKLEAVGHSAAAGNAILYVSSDRRQLIISICTKDLSTSIKGALLFKLDADGAKQHILFIASHKFRNGHASLETYPDARIMQLLMPKCSCSLAICTELHDNGELISEFQIGCSTHVVRRLDIKVYPPEQHPTALLYFTGSAHFNRSIRLFADKSGFLLNDYGLFKRLTDTARSRDQHQKSSHGEQIRCLSERDIFTHLKLQYVEPERRHDQGDVIAFK
jgi:DNA polymerase/3'-5' exonuclease PolX